MSQAFDYRGWVERAKAFTERCRSLPGEIVVTVEVALPMSEEDVESVAKTLPRGIPTPIRRFLTNGSGDCHCKYWWKPLPDRDAEMPFDAAVRQLVPFYSVFPDNTFIYGGANLCNPVSRGAKDIGNGITVVERSGFRGLQTGRDSIAPMVELVEERRLFLESFPFLDIMNGDMVAVHPANSDAESPVVYLSHEAYGASCVIAPSFEDFLTQWEQLCYVGPELWVLEAFRDPKTGFVDGQCGNAMELRTMFDRLLA